jgi:tetratricopeptide (TPR) repeat protein
MSALGLVMTTQKEAPHEPPVTELHLVTWNDFFPCRTDTAAELQAPAPPQKDDRPSARAALERVLQADSNSKHHRPHQLETANTEKKPISNLRQTKINRRSALAKRKLETFGQEVAESTLLHLATIEIEGGNKEEARQLLRQLLKANPRFEPGWLRMADAVDSDEEQRFCLEQALVINRRNALARRRLEALTASVSHPKQANSEKPMEAQAEPSASKNWLFRLRTVLQKYSVSLAIIYLGVLVIAQAFALIVPQSRLVLYGVLLIILMAHTALTWGHSSSRLILIPTFAPLIRAVSTFSD